MQLRYRPGDERPKLRLVSSSSEKGAPADPLILLDVAAAKSEIWTRRAYSKSVGECAP